MIYFSLFFFLLDITVNVCCQLLSVIKNFDMDLMELPMVQVKKVGTLIWIWWSCLRFKKDIIKEVS